MEFKKVLEQLNFLNQCKEYNLSLWQCPSFLTVVMGLVTIAAMISTYLIANYYATEPEISALIVLLTTAVIFTIGYFIIRSFSYLAEANKMKSEFVSITTHQLRTPLSSAKWSLNLLMENQKENIDPKQKEYLEIIRESNERMIRLVNDLLNVSKIEQNRLDLKPQKFSLNELLKEVVTEINPLARSNNISLKLELTDLPDVLADKERIHLVVENLLDNAIKYSNENSAVEIKLEKYKNYLKCSVKDNGVGIPEHQKNQVFQKFFRSDNAKKLQTTGTGLGLFIAKAIVEASGGTIGFTSKEGKGSTFWFTIPIAK